MQARKQQGIALMTVLLVLAIASIAIVSMSSSRQLDIRRTENLMRTGQGREYLYSIESWASEVLNEKGFENKVDGIDDQWHKPLQETRIPGGSLQAHIIDLQGRFNLNNLMLEDKPNDLAVQRFRRLLALLKIKPELSDPILDWIDADSEIRYPAGAEDETYLRQTPPYRSANGKFADISELLLISGINREIYQKLKPYIYVTESNAPININTAGPLILRCLIDKFTKDKVDSLIHDRNDEVFEKVDDFIKQASKLDLLINKEGLSVSSDNFLLSSSVILGRIALTYESQMERSNDAKAVVIKRMRKGIADD